MYPDYHTLSLTAVLPISRGVDVERQQVVVDPVRAAKACFDGEVGRRLAEPALRFLLWQRRDDVVGDLVAGEHQVGFHQIIGNPEIPTNPVVAQIAHRMTAGADRKSTRLNSSH